MKHLVTAAVLVTCLVGVTIDGTAQQPIVPVDFRPFSDGQHWIVKEPLTYIVGQSQERVTVPVGFVTDMASIPPALQSIIQQNGSYLLPAVVHDYLYWKQTCTRTQADSIMLLAMVEQNVSLVHRTAIFEAVRAAGSFAWEANARDRTARLPRIIPPTHLRIPPNVSWSGYQQQLVNGRVTEGPDTPIAASFCARGDMPVDVALRP